RGLVRVNREGSIRKVAAELGPGRHIDAVLRLRCRQKWLVLFQTGVRRAALVELHRVQGVCSAQAVDPLPTAVEIVETVVLLVDDDDVVDAGKRRLTGRRSYRRDGAKCEQRR